MAERHCPINNCGAAIVAERFACGRHWFQLSRAERAEIYAVYDGWKRGEVEAEELRRRQQAVIDAVNLRIAARQVSK
jgi:hypothetical protein